MQMSLSSECQVSISANCRAPLLCWFPQNKEDGKGCKHVCAAGTFKAPTQTNSSVSLARRAFNPQLIRLTKKKSHLPLLNFKKSVRERERKYSFVGNKQKVRKTGDLLMCGKFFCVSLHDSSDLELSAVHL